MGSQYPYPCSSPCFILYVLSFIWTVGWKYHLAENKFCTSTVSFFLTLYELLALFSLLFRLHSAILRGCTARRAQRTNMECQGCIHDSCVQAPYCALASCTTLRLKIEHLLPLLRSLLISLFSSISNLSVILSSVHKNVNLWNHHRSESLPTQPSILLLRHIALHQLGLSCVLT